MRECYDCDQDKEIAAIKAQAKADVAQLAAMCNEVVKLREALEDQ
jgi:hypothetical protein